MGFWRSAAGAMVLACSADAAWSETMLKIGVLNDQSGPYADIGGSGSVAAAHMAVEDFKATDKGLRVEIVAADHQNKADIGSAIARQWYDRDNVDMIVDVPTSSVAFAVSEITRDRDKVFLVTGAAASDLTGPKCSPNTIHWTFDTYALSQAVAKAQVKLGGDSWFFITADYSYGHALERDTSAVVTQSGGKVVGSVKAPFPTTDFSSYLIRAQSSNAKVIGLANGGSDTTNAIKQAGEFGVTQSGQKIASLALFISDIESLGLQAAQGVILAEPFYWDLNDGTRAWSQRFAARNGGKIPTAVQAGVYSAVLHYLKAAEQLQAKAGTQIINKMKDMEVRDPLFGTGTIRADGRKIHDMYVFEVKKPTESEQKGDDYKLLATVPGPEAFRPMSEGGCPFVKK